MRSPRKRSLDHNGIGLCNCGGELRKKGIVKNYRCDGTKYVSGTTCKKDIKRRWRRSSGSNWRMLKQSWRMSLFNSHKFGTHVSLHAIKNSFTGNVTWTCTGKFLQPSPVHSSGKVSTACRAAVCQRATRSHRLSTDWCRAFYKTIKAPMTALEREKSHSKLSGRIAHMRMGSLTPRAGPGYWIRRDSQYPTLHL